MPKTNRSINFSRRITRLESIRHPRDLKEFLGVPASASFSQMREAANRQSHWLIQERSRAMVDKMEADEWLNNVLSF